MLQYEPSFAFDDEPHTGPDSQPQESVTRLDDGALLDAYSRAVTEVVDRLG
ncbi:MAG: serine protease, partial [Alphaproteobacteria bacterium]